MKTKIYNPILIMTILSLLIITVHLLGFDSYSTILIGVNPILNILSKVKVVRLFLNSGFLIPVCNKPGLNGISVYWYIASLLSFIFYGIIIKLIICVFIKRN